MQHMGKPITPEDIDMLVKKGNLEGEKMSKDIPDEIPDEIYVHYSSDGKLSGTWFDWEEEGKGNIKYARSPAKAVDVEAMAAEMADELETLYEFYCPDKGSKSLHKYRNYMDKRGLLAPQPSLPDIAKDPLGHHIMALEAMGYKTQLMVKIEEAQPPGDAAMIESLGFVRSMLQELDCNLPFIDDACHAVLNKFSAVSQQDAVKELVAGLEKLADPNFNWSEDCGNQLPYDEWVPHVAQNALAAFKTKGD